MTNARPCIGPLLVMCCVTASGAESEPLDKGWIASNMGGGCQMLRAGRNVDPSDVTAQQLMVQVLSDPSDKQAVHRGETMLSFALFGEKGIMKNEEVASFTVLEAAGDSSTRLVVTPLPDRWLSFVLDEKADSTLDFFSGERLVRVQRRDGSTSVFRFAVNGYASSRAMFDACVRVLQKDA